MTDNPLGRYLLAGLDERARGFTRQVDLESDAGGIRACFHYESLCLTSPACGTQEQALADLIAALQSRGYRQLRSRLTFTGNRYLGSLEPWIEYPDPAEEPAELRGGVFSRLRRIWKRGIDR